MKNSTTPFLPLTPSGVAVRNRWLGLPLLLAACLLFLSQVLPYLSHRWVTDESWYAGPAYSIAQGQGVRDPAIGPNDLEHHFDARPPGTAMVISVFFKAFGTGQSQARLGSVLAGLVTVLMVWRLTRDDFGAAGAGLASLLVASDNLLVIAGRSARPEALTTMCVVAALLLFKQYARSGRVRWCAATGIALALGTMFHVTVLGYVVSFALLAIGVERRWARRAAWSLCLRCGVPGRAGSFCSLDPHQSAGNCWLPERVPLTSGGFATFFEARSGRSSLLGCARVEPTAWTWSAVVSVSSANTAGLCGRQRVALAAPQAMVLSGDRAAVADSAVVCRNR